MTGGASAKKLDIPAPRSVHRYIIFLPGVCAYPYSDPYCYGRVSATNRARATFRTLIAAMARANIKYIPLYYSYDAQHPDYYSVSQTHHNVAASALALQQQISRVWSQDHEASFVLVGHSLGGVVAVEWEARAAHPKSGGGSPALQRRIHSIVTFDSPIRGLPALYTNSFVAQVFGGAILSSLRPDSTVIKQILSFSDTWWGTTGRLHTVTNRADKIVPWRQAALGMTRVVNDRICDQDLFLLRSCHGAVLTDAPLNSWIACHWITDTQQCQARPTTTPTPKPSPTTTSSPTPTAMPQPSPTGVPPPPPPPSQQRIKR